MPNPTKQKILGDLAGRSGKLQRLGDSRSLYEVNDGLARIYVRYSKVHDRGQTFYGLRDQDLRELEGRNSFICFIWDDCIEPVLVPFAEYEDVFHDLTPAGDGQYKAQLYFQDSGTELYIANAGRFNVEAHYGWDHLDDVLRSDQLEKLPDFSHSQIQTLLGAIGTAKNFDVWIPPDDRLRLDWTIARRFECRDDLPHRFRDVESILQEVDVLWLKRGSSDLDALFEVEHSTPIYSGLLRFNDIYLTVSGLRPRFSIVANENRRSLFVRQLNRPTFRTSGLSEQCTFLEYANVFSWHQRVT